MAWNEPGKGGKDPWGRGNGNQGPPDLEELLRRLRQRLGGIGGGFGGSGGSIGALLIVAVLVLIWMLSGFYKVDSAQQAAVLRFGKLTHTSKPGLHWHIPYPIEAVKKVNVDRIRSFPYQSNMLTGDENIVHLQLQVQYKVKNAGNYLFKIRDPDATLGEATKSAIRLVVGTSQISNVLSGQGRTQIASRSEKLLQSNLDEYKSGLEVTTINIQSAQPPDQVQAAYSDAIKAQQDKQRAINHAEAYSNQVLPRAKGEAAQRIAQAKGYAQKVVEQAKGRSSRFDQLLAVYHKAPDVTRMRLYLDSMEGLLERSSKVLLDVNKSNPLLYLPLDKLVHGQGKKGELGSSGSSSGEGSASGGSGGTSAGGSGSASGKANNQGSSSSSSSAGQTDYPPALSGRGRNR